MRPFSQYSDRRPDDAAALRRARFQLALGVTQIAGATAGLILLFTEGPSRRATVVVFVTLLIAVASRGIFRGELKKR